ncbi:MAG: TRAP transporter small permease subunit [Bacteroidota bacterium]
MRAFLSKLSFGIDVRVNMLGSLASWLTTVLMLVMCVDVLLRYAFDLTQTWVIELEWHLFAILFLVGASYTLLYDKHVRVDMFYERYPQRWKGRVNAFGTLLLLVPWCIIIMIKGFDYTANSWSFREGSPQPNGLPARYLIKAFIPIGFGLLLLQAISEIIRSLIRKKG